MPYRVMTVSNRRRMKDFLRLPFGVYREDPNWVAPMTLEVRRVLDEKRNPYFANANLKLFVCYRDGAIAARTAVIINQRHHEKFGVKAAFFGFFESINDLDAVRCLFDEAERYCKSQQIEWLEGPFNPNHYSELGLQVNKFGSPPTFFQPYNLEYYSELLAGVGFHISARLHTRKNENITVYVLNRYGTRMRSLQRDGYTVRSFAMADRQAELERIRDVFNDAFSSNWHFLPLSQEEYLFSAKYLSLVTSPDLIQIVEHHGKSVGVLHCVLDINPLLRRMNGRAGPVKYLRFLRQRKHIRNLVIYAVGVKKAYQHTHVYPLILGAMCQIALNYQSLETTWMSEENIPAVRAAEDLGLKPDKQFVIYAKHLAE